MTLLATLLITDHNKLFDVKIVNIDKMFSITDSCLLCHKLCKNHKNILLQDTDGVLIEEKLKFFLFELVQAKLAILKQICMQCLDKLNYVYQFKHTCLRNIISFNNSLHSLGNVEQPNKNIQITLTSQNIPQTTQVRNEVINNSTIRSTTKINTQNSQTQINILKRKEDYKTVQELMSSEKEDSNDKIYGTYMKLENETMDVGCELNVAEEIVIQTTKNIDKKSNIKPKPAEINSKKHFLSLMSQNKTPKTSGNVVRRHFNGEKHHKYKISNKELINEPNPKDHLHFKHTGNKQYSCDKCDRLFISQINLYHHKKTHSSDRPYHCNLCSCKFINDNGLKHHIRLIHSN